jgi:hypothetical protein
MHQLSSKGMISLAANENDGIIDIPILHHRVILIEILDLGIAFRAVIERQMRDIGIIEILPADDRFPPIRPINHCDHVFEIILRDQHFDSPSSFVDTPIIPPIKHDRNPRSWHNHATSYGIILPRQDLRSCHPHDIVYLMTNEPKGNPMTLNTELAYLMLSRTDIFDLRATRDSDELITYLINEESILDDANSEDLADLRAIMNGMILDPFNN